jgi:hypothetical protein
MEAKEARQIADQQFHESIKAVLTEIYSDIRTKALDGQYELVYGIQYKTLSNLNIDDENSTNAIYEVLRGKGYVVKPDIIYSGSLRDVLKISIKW